MQFELQASQPKEFALHFRIPAWAEGATLSVNGKQWTAPTIPGSFAAIPRTWKSGDRVDLHLPMKTRLEPIDANHPDIAALLCGPLVLFGIQANGKPITREQLLAATQTNPTTWQAQSGSGPIILRPFISITNERYSTYFHL